MLSKEEIKNGNLVYDEDRGTYHYILDVGNAIDKGDRDTSNNPSDELSYSTINFVDEDYADGICEHSGITQALRIATVREVELFLMVQEANASSKMAKAKKKHAVLQQTLYNFKQKYGNNEQQ
jgi:hypothetical protein